MRRSELATRACGSQGEPNSHSFHMGTQRAFMSSVCGDTEASKDNGTGRGVGDQRKYASRSF